MNRHCLLFSSLLVLSLAAVPALAQNDTNAPGPSETVGSAPGADEEDDDETADDEPVGDEDASESEASDDGSDIDQELEPMTTSPDDRASTETDEASDPGDHPSTVNTLVVAPHAGATWPAFDDLGVWGTFGLEVGILPRLEEFRDKPLEVAVIARYTQPSATGSASDPNLGVGGGTYDWHVAHQTLGLDAIGLWRFHDLAAHIAPYVLGGLRTNFSRTVLSGADQASGASFGTLRETNVHVGFVAGGGADFHLGDGTLFGELTFGWTKLDQHLTALGSTTAFGLDVGYRFFPL